MNRRPESGFRADGMTNQKPPSDISDAQRVPDEDPLVELARIVSEGDDYGRNGDPSGLSEYEPAGHDDPQVLTYEQPVMLEDQSGYYAADPDEAIPEEEIGDGYSGHPEDGAYHPPEPLPYDEYGNPSDYAGDDHSEDYFSYAHPAEEAPEEAAYHAAGAGPLYEESAGDGSDLRFTGYDEEPGSPEPYYEEPLPVGPEEVYGAEPEDVGAEAADLYVAAPDLNPPPPEPVAAETAGAPEGEPQREVEIDLAHFESELLADIPAEPPVPPAPLPVLPNAGEIDTGLERFSPAVTGEDPAPRKGPDLSELEGSLKDQGGDLSLDGIDLEGKPAKNRFDAALEAVVAAGVEPTPEPKGPPPLPESYKEPLPPATPAVYASYPIPGQHSDADEKGFLAKLGGNSGKALVAIALVGLAVILGGLGIVFFTGNSSDLPETIPVIRADAGDFKEYPETDGTTDENLTERVYDRVEASPAADVAGSDANTSPSDVIVSRNDENLQITLPVGTENADGSEAQGLPGVRSSAQVAPGEPSGVAPNSPRPVRVVVVRPDGTIINEGPGAEVPADTGERLTVPAIFSDTPQQTAAPSSAAETDPSASETPRQVTVLQPQASTAAPAESPSASEPAPVAVAVAEPAPAAPEPEEAAPASIPLPAVNPTPRPAFNPVAQAPDRAADTATASQQAAVTQPTGTHGVQLSSQRSRAAAESTFATLQRRFPAILGNLEPVYQEATLSSGTWYRVSVGPVGNSAEANALCNQLKAAGGDCFVKRF